MFQDFQNITGVGVAALSVFFLYKMGSNHIDHNTKAIQELTEVIRELKEFMQNHLKIK